MIKALMLTVAAMVTLGSAVTVQAQHGERRERDNRSEHRQDRGETRHGRPDHVQFGHRPGRYNDGRGHNNDRRYRGRYYNNGHYYHNRYRHNGGWRYR